jgi:hypothetical protein
MLVLRAHAISRNRNFALFAAPHARALRGRATALRGLVRQLTGAQGPATSIQLAPNGDGSARLRFALPRIALQRELVLGAFELAVVRVALAASGARLLPGALRPTDDDAAQVARALDAFVPASP